MAFLPRSARRKLRRFVGWEKLKEAGVYLLDALLDLSPRLPPGFHENCIAFSCALLRAFYWFPLNPWRKAARDAALLSGRPGRGGEIYRRLVDNLAEVASLFLVVIRSGAAAASGRMGFEEGSAGKIAAVMSEHGAGFLLLPHCVGGVLSAAFFARAVPTVVLSKGPPTPKRAEIQRKFIKMLGVELLVIDDMEKSTVARNILRVIKSGKFIVATTDLMKKTSESIESTFFGRPVHLPSWPARFSAKTGCPIVPGYVSVRNGRLEIRAGDPYVEKDLAAATRRWSSEFEKYILERPEDWAFLFDLRWGKILREASRLPAYPPDGAAGAGIG